MAVEISVIQLPGGASCIRIVSSGTFTKEDAEAVLARTGPGKPEHHLPQLVLTHGLTKASPEARGMFTGSAGPEASWSAIVVVNPVIRVASSFMIRVSGSKKTRLFSDEAEAVRWLEERLREGATRTSST